MNHLPVNLYLFPDSLATIGLFLDPREVYSGIVRPLFIITCTNEATNHFTPPVHFELITSKFCTFHTIK